VQIRLTTLTRLLEESAGAPSKRAVVEIYRGVLQHVGRQLYFFYVEDGNCPPLHKPSTVPHRLGDSAEQIFRYVYQVMKPDPACTDFACIDQSETTTWRSPYESRVGKDAYTTADTMVQFVYTIQLMHPRLRTM